MTVNDMMSRFSAWLTARHWLVQGLIFSIPGSALILGTWAVTRP